MESAKNSLERITTAAGNLNHMIENAQDREVSEEEKNILAQLDDMIKQFENAMDDDFNTADAISAARPGARRETLEAYIKRLEKLEEIANSYEGVDKSYAIQAGREIRIMVKPEQLDDAGSIELARDLAKSVEEQLEYPGQIKINVIREIRAVDFAK